MKNSKLKTQKSRSARLLWSPRVGSQGQVVVILLMVMVTVLTIGLSVASRATTDVHRATVNEESARAFSAAEAGLEKALAQSTLTDFTIPSSDLGNIGAQATIDVQDTIVGNAFAFPGDLKTDDPVQIWLTDYPAMSTSYAGSSMDIYWGNPGTSCPNAPALLITEITDSGSTYQVKNSALDSCGRNNFDSSGITANPAGIATNLGADTRFAFKRTLTTSPNLKFMRIRSVFFNGALGVKTDGAALPAQGQIVESTGTVGEAQRRIQLFRSYAQLPGNFDDVLFSEGDVGK